MSKSTKKVNEPAFYEIFGKRYAEDPVFVQFCVNKGLITKKSKVEEGRQMINAYFNQTLHDTRGTAVIRSYLKDFEAAKLNQLMTDAGFTGDDQYSRFQKAAAGNPGAYAKALSEIKILDGWMGRKTDIIDKIDEVVNANAEEISKRKKNAYAVGGALASAAVATSVVLFHIAKDYPEYLEQEVGKAVTAAMESLYADYAASVGMSVEEVNELLEVALNPDIIKYAQDKAVLDESTAQTQQAMADFYGVSEFNDRDISDFEFLDAVEAQARFHHRYPDSNCAHAAVTAMNTANKEAIALDNGMGLEEANEYIAANPDDTLAQELAAAFANSDSIHNGFHAQVDATSFSSVGADINFPWPNSTALDTKLKAFEADIQAQYDALDTGGATPEQIALLPEAQDMLESLNIFQENRIEEVTQSVTDSNSELMFGLDNMDLPEVAGIGLAGAVAGALIRTAMVARQWKKASKIVDKSKELKEMLEAEERYERDVSVLKRMDMTLSQ